MWLVLTRKVQPDRPHWPGRRVCAAVDAVGWPMAWVAAAMQFPRQGGLVGAVIVMCATLAAASRLYRAIGSNHRYAFTTWRWSKALAGLLIGAAIVKVTIG